MNENDQILVEAASFFEEIYSDRASEDSLSPINLFLPFNYKSITSQDQEILSANITLQELETSIKGMRNGQSPGLDGFTVEFYGI